MEARVKRVSFLYTNGDKKRKEFNNVTIAFDQGCLCIYNVPSQHNHKHQDRTRN